MSKIKLIVTDMDGCLLDGAGRLPADFGEAFDSMRRNDIILPQPAGGPSAA